MNAAYVSAIVALAAVIVGGVMQVLTLRAGRRTTDDTLQHVALDSRMRLMVEANRAWEEGFRADLAEYSALQLHVQLAFDLRREGRISSEMEKRDATWQFDGWVIWNRMNLRLRQGIPSDDALLSVLRKFRDTNDVSSANKELYQAAGRFFEDKRREAFEADVVSARTMEQK